VPAVGDYDGDGKADIAVFRPSTGIWSISRSTAGEYGIAFGQNGDKVVEGDYDGDGKTDVAVFRPSNGVWYVANIVANIFSAVQFGNSTDIPVPGDYDGDGKTDQAIFRPADGNWWLNRSSAGVTVVQWGQNGDKPTPSAFGN
jgi:hypothetical protein